MFHPFPGPHPYAPPARPVPFPPHPVPENPFPTLTTEPTATQAALDAEIARAKGRENEIASGLSAIVDEAISNAIDGSVTPAVARAVDAANAAASAANAAASGARSVVADAAVAAARTAVAEKMGNYSLNSHAHSEATSSGNGFMSSGDKAKLDNYPANPGDIVSSGLYDAIVELASTYARKSYVDDSVTDAKVYARAQAGSAARMTASTDGNSQIQISNSGVATVKVKRAVKAVLTDQEGNEHVFGWTPVDTEYSEGGQASILYIETGKTRSQWESSANGVFAMIWYKNINQIKFKSNTHDYMLYNRSFTSGELEYEHSPSAIDPREWSVKAYENEIVTSYLVTESAVGDLAAKIISGSVASGAIYSAISGVVSDAVGAINSGIAASGFITGCGLHDALSGVGIADPSGTSASGTVFALIAALHAIDGQAEA